ncbi:uncharacterized protein V6R79_002138 [Siganus canaliculatus]
MALVSYVLRLNAEAPALSHYRCHALQLDRWPILVSNADMMNPALSLFVQQRAALTCPSAYPPVMFGWIPARTHGC